MPTLADVGNPPQVAEVKRKGSGSLATPEPSAADPGAVSLSDLGPQRLPSESLHWPLKGEAPEPVTRGADPWHPGERSLWAWEDHAPSQLPHFLGVRAPCLSFPSGQNGPWQSQLGGPGLRCGSRAWVP